MVMGRCDEVAGGLETNIGRRFAQMNADFFKIYKIRGRRGPFLLL
jgi:hypothetical protein